MARLWGEALTYKDGQGLDGWESLLGSLPLTGASTEWRKGAGWGRFPGLRFYFAGNSGDRHSTAGETMPIPVAVEAPPAATVSPTSAAPRPATGGDTLMRFSKGLAQHVNDLFMSILGQNALCRLDASESGKLEPVLKKVEGLVQHGAHLTVHLLGLCGRGVFADPPYIEGHCDSVRTQMIGYAQEQFRSFPFYHLSAALGRRPVDMDTVHIACRQLSREYLIVFDHIRNAIDQITDASIGRRIRVMRRTILKGRRLMVEIARFAGADSRSRCNVTVTRSASVSRILRGVVRRLSTDQKALKVTVSTGLSVPSLDMLSADFRHVVAEVVKNAVEAMPNGGALTVTAISRQMDCAERSNSPSTCLEIAVSDTGNGIPDHVCRRIYDPFFTMKNDNGRLGLGLTGSLGRIQRVGGTIEVSSVHGVGTVVLIRIPAAVSRRPSPAFRADSSMPAAGTPLPGGC